MLQLFSETRSQLRSGTLYFAHVSAQILESSGAVHRFIFLSDIAGSSRLAEAYPREYARALAQHNALIEQAVAQHGGSVYKHTGDGYIALFQSAGACVGCAADLAVALAGIAPPADGEPLMLRIALHAGELQPAGAEYFGPALNRASRICQVCHPGQVLCSGAVAACVSGADGSVRDAISAGTAARPTKLLDLGLHHLRDLAEPEHLYQLDSERFARREFPPLATLNNRPNNLVTQPNRFIGRSRELAELAELMRTGQRLITIIAPGGYGKSRLAAQLCANLLPSFERGAFLAYLATARDSTMVPLAVASVLGLQFSGNRDPVVQLCDYLRAKQLLLCLDNFEHVLECAALVRAFLEAAPQLKLVITSREPLRTDGEHIFRLEPLGLWTGSAPLPGGDAPSARTEAGAPGYSDAERLFADRAALVNSAFALDPGNAALVHDICAKLSGIPLALELAAAWMDGFTLSELRDELGHQLKLEARTSDKPARHHSLQASLDWSWNLLGEAQQEMLLRCAVFRGGFFIEAASAVLNMQGLALRGALLKLCDKSWLYTREVDGRTRFFLRDMLAHEYAYAKLEQSRQPADGARQENNLYEQAVRAHAAYFATLAERLGPQLCGGGTADGGALQLAALRGWRVELQNFNAAFDYALKTKEQAWLTPLALYLRSYLSIVGAYHMLRERSSLLLGAAQEINDPRLLAQAQLGLGAALRRLGDHRAALTLYEQALAGFCAAGDRSGEATVYSNLAILESHRGHNSRAEELEQRSLGIRRELGDREGEANSLNVLGNIRNALADYDGATELYHQAAELYHAIGDRQGEVLVLSNLANVSSSRGDFARAVELHSQALAIHRQFGDRQGEAVALGGLGNAFHGMRDYARAIELQRQSLELRREIGDRRGEAYPLSALANACFVQGAYENAQALASEALAIFSETGNRLGEGACLSTLGNLHFCMGDYSRSIGLYRQALALFREIGSRNMLAVTLAYAAAPLATRQALRAAAILLYGGMAQAAAINYHFEPEEQKMLDAAQASLDSAAGGAALSAPQLAELKSRAERMQLDELAQLALDELAQFTDAPGPGDGSSLS